MREKREEEEEREKYLFTRSGSSGFFAYNPSRQQWKFDHSSVKIYSRLVTSSLEQEEKNKFSYKQKPVKIFLSDGGEFSASCFDVKKKIMQKYLRF